MSLLAQLHEIGLAMGGRYAPVEVTTEDEDGESVTVVYQRHVGWTTDQAKADAAQAAGARCSRYISDDPRFSGWEVSVNEAVDA